MMSNSGSFPALPCLMAGTMHYAKQLIVAVACDER